MELRIKISPETEQKLAELVQKYCNNCQDPLIARGVAFEIRWEIENEVRRIIRAWLDEVFLSELRKISREELKTILVEEFKRWLSDEGAIELFRRSSKLRQIMIDAVRYVLLETDDLKKTVTEYAKSDEFKEQVRNMVVENMDNVANSVVGIVGQTLAKDKSFILSIAEEVKPLVRDVIKDKVIEKVAEDTKERVSRLLSNREFTQQLADEVKPVVAERFKEVIPELVDEIIRELKEYVARQTKNELKKEVAMKTAEEVRRNL
ncbi:MAG: hypothetical protein QXU93_05465 [Thermoproteus sp.]